MRCAISNSEFWTMFDAGRDTTHPNGLFRRQAVPCDPSRMEPLVDFERMPTLGAIAAYHAHERPNAIALSFEGRQTNFAEFDRRTN